MSEPQGGRKGMNRFYPALLTPDVCINANVSHGHRVSHQVTAPINSHRYSKLLPASCMDANDRAQVYTSCANITYVPELFLLPSNLYVCGGFLLMLSTLLINANVTTYGFLATGSPFHAAGP